MVALRAHFGQNPEIGEALCRLSSMADVSARACHSTSGKLGWTLFGDEFVSFAELIFG